MGFECTQAREARVQPDLDDAKQKTFSAIYRAIIAYLARREHSVQELSQKLSKRFAEDKRLVDRALEKAIADGYQSDQRFAEAYARSRVNKGFGGERIANELRQKGISTDLIEQAVAELETVDAERDALAYTWQKKYNSPPQNFNEKMKQVRFLRYRGFSSEQIEQFYGRLEAAGGEDV